MNSDLQHNSTWVESVHFQSFLVVGLIYVHCKKVLESLEHATKRGARIIAEYLGGAITCDAHHLTDPRADGSGVAACIDKGLQNAGVSPEEVLK